MPNSEFKKLAAAAKDNATLEQLKYFRHKTAARLVLAERSGMFPNSFIEEVKESIKEYDIRIAKRERNIAHSAKLAMLKTAIAVGQT